MPDTTLDVVVSIDRYFVAWNALDPDDRARLVAEAWSEECRYVDPLVDVEGHAAIGSMIGGVHEQYPGVTLRRSSAIDAHHDVVRFAWEIVGDDGTVALDGIDVCRLVDDGRLVDVRGFFGLTAPQ